MSKLTILVGDFPAGVGHFTFRHFTLPGDEHHLCETINIAQVTFLNGATEQLLLLLKTTPETKEFISDADKEQVFFMVKLEDQRKFVAATDEKTFANILRAVERESKAALGTAAA